MRNGNILCQYDIEKNGAAWIWVEKDQEKGSGCAVEFQLEFQLNEPLETDFHISADNRFEASLDSALFGTGPDRCDLTHWSFHSYHCRLAPGKHVWNVLCWHFPGFGSPRAQLSWQPGFIFACSDGEYARRFNTGVAPWQVRKLPGISFAHEGQECLFPPEFRITEKFIINGGEYSQKPPFQDAVIVHGPFQDSPYGCIRPGWRLYPSAMPEQIHAERSLQGGKACAFLNQSAGFGQTVDAAAMNSGELPRWQNFIDNDEALVVEANQTFAVLIDLANYYCGYPLVELSGGDGDSAVCISWAEALHLPDGTKGNRNQILDKAFPLRSQGDMFTGLDGQRHLLRPFWWRAGRYLLVSIRNGKTPFRIHKIGFIESRYPMELEGSFTTSEDKINRIIPMMVRSMQMCSHETYMDCPYYEQLMYVGDSRLEALVSYVMMADPRLPERAIDLFDWSRNEMGDFTAERYPCRDRQLSLTFSMIWVFMVKDYLLYRGFEPQKLRRLRNAVRTIANSLAEYLNDDHLLENLPGWSFMDWVPQDSGWNRYGMPTVAEEGKCCAIFNVMYLGVLQELVALEELHPDGATISTHYREQYERIRSAVMTTFFVPERHLLADDAAKTSFSTHTQCLALLYDVLPETEREECLDALLTDKTLAQPTIYFSYYLFEVMQKFGRAERIPELLELWQEQYLAGAVTTWERPEPSRSDCHAWGAHPLYHYYSSIAGIRPAAPGFKRIRVVPQLGKLAHVAGEMPHPNGIIAFDFQNTPTSFTGDILLPEGCCGEFVYHGMTQELTAGQNHIAM